MAGKRARKQEEQDGPEVVGFLGVGLDDAKGHRRMTTGENFFLFGGSESTHDRMIDTAIQVNDKLRRQGKRLNDASPEEIRDLFRDVMDRNE